MAVVSVADCSWILYLGQKCAACWPVPLTQPHLSTAGVKRSVASAGELLIPGIASHSAGTSITTANRHFPKYSLQFTCLIK